jgi:hypothetical protein
MTSKGKLPSSALTLEIINNTHKDITDKVLYARLRGMEIDGASDRKMYSEVFKYIDPKEIPAFPGGLKYVERCAYCFRFVANEKYYRTPRFEVTPVQDIEQELRALAIRFDYELSSEEYKKAELLEIEGLPYDKKYLLPPRVKWTL